MSMQGNNINVLKQLPIYGRTIKLRIKEFTNAKLLSELPFLEKPIKAEIKQLSTKGLLRKQPFYKESIKKALVEKLNNHELLRELPFSDDNNISRKERAYKKYAETYEVEIINSKSLSDSMSMGENSIKHLFDDLLGEKRGFNYTLSNKIILKKRIKTVCSCRVTHAFQSESTLYSCLNVKELLARSRREI